MKYLEIKNLRKYQHYSDRGVAWIKWYVKCLDDYAFCQLNDRERWLFVGLVILCMEAGGTPIPLNYNWVRGRVCHIGSEGGGAGVSGVRVSIEKMAKLNLIVIKNASIEKRREEKKERAISSYKEKLTAYENGDKWNERPYYKKEPMRWYYKKWQVFNEGQWKDFAGDYKEIEWQ